MDKTRGGEIGIAENFRLDWKEWGMWTALHNWALALWWTLLGENIIIEGWEKLNYWGEEPKRMNDEGYKE